MLKIKLPKKLIKKVGKVFNDKLLPSLTAMILSQLLSPDLKTFSRWLDEWNNNSCPRDWRLLASWEVNWGPPWNPSGHHSTIILRGLREALNWLPLMLRGTRGRGGISLCSNRYIYKSYPQKQHVKTNNCNSSNWNTVNGWKLSFLEQNKRQAYLDQAKFWL